MTIQLFLRFPIPLTAVRGSEPAVQVVILKYSWVAHEGCGLCTGWSEEETAQLWWPILIHDMQKAEE